MFVVMAVGASEAEILGVKSQILAEGMTPFDHAGAERVVIAVVGEVGARRQVLMTRLASLSGVESVTPISRPFKLTSREFHPENTVIRILDAEALERVRRGARLERAAAQDRRPGRLHRVGRLE